MAEAAWMVVCEPEAPTTVSGDAYCSGTAEVTGAPIDDYYEYVEHLLTLGSVAALNASPTLGRLLVLGLVSGVESYLRSLIASVVRLCPLAREHAADQHIPFGAIDYYGPESAERALFESSSLADSGEIIGKTRKLTGIDLSHSSSARAALKEFDKVCHLRHAAVHARGTFGRGNAVALGLDLEAGRQSLSVSFAGLQQAGATCHSAVRAYNRFVYRRIVERWIAEGLLTGRWQTDRELFRPLFELFHSRRDGVGCGNAYQAFRTLPTRSTP